MRVRKVDAWFAIIASALLGFTLRANAEVHETTPLPPVAVMDGILLEDGPSEAFRASFSWMEPREADKAPAIPSPWSFGWTQALTLLGLLITTAIAVVSLKTFDKWKREKIEEKRLDVALEALAVAYEARYVFEGIRSPGSSSSEWSDLQVSDEKKKDAAGPFYAILKRIDHNKDYFSRVWRLQSRFMAAFGKDTAEHFMEFHRARRAVEVSAGMLMRGKLDGDRYEPEFREKLEADIWDMSGLRPDEVGKRIEQFVGGIEKSCLPIVIHGYSAERSKPLKRAYAWCVNKLGRRKLASV